MSDFEKKDIGAIWIMKSRNGKNYLSMSIEIDGEKRQFVAFKNHKRKDTHPDYRIFASQPQQDKPEPEEDDIISDDDAASSKDFPF